MCLKTAGWVANSVNPDQMLHLIWVYTVCSDLSVPIISFITVFYSKTGYVKKEIYYLTEQLLEGLW